MRKLTFDDFKNHPVFLVFTVLMGYLTAVGLMVEPEYLSGGTAIILAIILIPLDALWFQYFWNIVVRKLFSNTPELSYGASFVVAMCFYWFLS